MKSLPAFLFLLAGLVVAPLSAQPLPEHALVRIGDSRFHGSGHRMRFAPDGKTLAVASQEKVRLIDPVTGVERLVLRHLSKSLKASTEETGHDIIEMAFLADGKSLVTADVPGVIRVWDLTTGAEKRFPQAHPGIASLCVSADDKSVFTSGFDGVLHQWELPDGKEVKSWTAPKKQPILAIATLGQNVAAVTKDGILHIWDPQTGQPARSVELGPIVFNTNVGYASRVFPSKGSSSFAGFVRNIEFSVNGKYLVQHNGQQIWDVETGKVLTNLPQPGQAKKYGHFAIAPDGKSVAATGTAFKQPMRLFASATGDELAGLEAGTINAVAISPDGTTVAYSADNRIRLWKHATKEVHGGADDIGRISDWDLSRDGKQIAVVTFDNVLRLFDTQTGKQRETFSTEDRRANLVRFHSDGQTLIVGASGIGVLHYAKKDAQWQAVQRFPMNEQLFDIAGHGLFVPFGPKSTTLMNMETGKTIRSGLAQGVGYSQFAYSPDGRWLVVHAEGQFKAAPPKFKTTGREHQLLRVPELSKIHSLPGIFMLSKSAFSPDGRLLMIGNDSVQLFEILSGAERLKVPMPFLRGAIAFTPDGKGLIAGTPDGDLVVLGLPKGEEVYRVKKGHTTRVDQIRPAADGKVISVGSDHTFMIWSADLWKGRFKISPLKLDPEDYDLFYENLKAASGPNIHTAIDTLIRGGDGTVQYLNAKLQPAREQEAPGATRSAQRLREHRAVEILESIGTANARTVLQSLASGHRMASLTVEATEAMQRLTSPK